MIALTVIICTHSPDRGRLARVLASLAGQTLAASRWELLVVDNLSSPALTEAELAAVSGFQLRLVREDRLGLSHARRRGFTEARGELLLLVDDDNVLAPDYLARTVAHFAAHPDVGAFGGPVHPEFAQPPPAWTQEFYPLLAVRDLGPEPRFAGMSPHTNNENVYPDCAPIGAGLALRRTAVRAWIDRADPVGISDRRGQELTSGGDNDIVLHVLHAGWRVAYFPDLELRHLIPPARLTPAYLARLNRGIQRSWVQVLATHRACPWPAIRPWTTSLRVARAYLRCRAWQSPAHHIRWAGLRGRFEGQAAVWRSNRERQTESQ